MSERLWFSRDPNGDGFELHGTEAEARAAAEAAFAQERSEAASDGWAEEVTDICWGRLLVMGRVVETERAVMGGAAWVDYALSEERRADPPG